MTARRRRVAARLTHLETDGASRTRLSGGRACRLVLRRCPIEVQDLGNRQTPIRSKGGAIQWLCWDTATARLLPRLPGSSFRMSGPAVSCLNARPSRPAGRCPAASARTPAGPASAMTAAASCWATTPAWSSASSGAAPRPTPAAPKSLQHIMAKARHKNPRAAMRIRPGGEGVAWITGILGPAHREN